MNTNLAHALTDCFVSLEEEEEEEEEEEDHDDVCWLKMPTA
jgi:hypothetical protein